MPVRARAAEVLIDRIVGHGGFAAQVGYRINHPLVRAEQHIGVGTRRNEFSWESQHDPGQPQADAQAIVDDRLNIDAGQRIAM